ncbi:MAG: KH domain-containing protein [Candidatus Aminicenantes bacterium]|nr:KH domain-containing protein [Candidatus Aminicenantes bacterium]
MAGQRRPAHPHRSNPSGTGVQEANRRLSSFFSKKEVAVKELVELIAKALVDNPDRVVVSQLEGEQTTILELKVAPEDLGKVIGKQGRTARAIRIILGAAGMKLRRRFNLEIIEKG